MGYRPGRYAAFDIGTVTCRMLVADVDDKGQLDEVAKRYTITDLGVGVDATGRLSDAAMERVTGALAAYQRDLTALAAERPLAGSLAMATSAARDAANADEFRDRLAKVGITLAVIPGEHEASLSFRGASSDFPGENLLVVDIGGGSTELIAGRFGEEPVASHSFNVGCRRMTERFFHSDPPTSDEQKAARTWVRTQMTPFFDRLSALGFSLECMVAVAGTATSVVSIREAMEVYDSSRVHKARVTMGELRAIEERLAAQPLARRRETVGLDPKRAGVIVAGFLILEEVMGLAGVSAYTVSESDILHGMILEAARA